MTAVDVAAAERGLALRTHLDAAGRTCAYLLLSLPLGVAGLLSLPALPFTRAAAARIAALRRRLANSLLRARIPVVADDLAGHGTGRVVELLAAPAPATAVAAVAAATPVVLAFLLGVTAYEGLLGDSDRYVAGWSLGAPVGAALAVLALAAIVVSVAVLEGLAAPLQALERRLLVSSAQPVGAVREALAATIGDRSLTVAYWLPDRGAFVDEHGLPVELPTPDSGRTWTAVEHEGRRVAAIIHDAHLDATPELVGAAAAGAVLALDNERLKAALRARVEDLRASRARIVEASIEARRDLERDLHDGAQQQLVALSLDLQLVRARVRDDPEALALVDGSIEKLTTALNELRELARGIHPAILTQRGLAPAVVALVERTPVPVTTEVELDERLPPGVEAAAYFTVAEALTNVAKYARASAAVVRVRRDPDALVVEVEDDGVGGAEPAAGSGLRGLEDRVSALDGTLVVESLPGKGTRVTARIPVPPAPRL